MEDIKFTLEQIEKARMAQSIGALISLAKENGINLSEAEATEKFEMLHKSGELADEELDNVAGGCGGTKEAPKDTRPCGGDSFFFVALQ